MTLESKFLIAIAALRTIAEYGHADDCRSSAPVHECCCRVVDEREIAKAALEELE